MSNTETIEKKNGVINEAMMYGRWRLKFNMENTLKADAFGGQLLDPYPDPFTRRMIYPLDENNRPLAMGYWVNDLVSMLNPDKFENPGHYNAIKFLLGHPLVGVEGVDINSKFKKKQAKLTLVNLDYERQKEVDDQEIVDRMIGRLSLDGGAHSVGKERLQCILAELNLPFTDARHIGNKNALKRALRTKVKDYVRKGKEQATKVENILDNMESAKRLLVVKYLVHFGTIEWKNGMFKYQNSPLGHNLDASADYLASNAELYGTLQKELEEQLKNEEA